MSYRDDDSCTFCREEPEKSLHLFWFCSRTQSFWKELVSFLIQRNIIGRNFALNKPTAMGLRPETSLNRYAINVLFSLARFLIWICRSKENIPKMKSFMFHSRHYKKEIEPYSIDKLLMFQLSTRDSVKTLLSTECLLFFFLKYYSLEFDLIFFPLN